jgi:hypothetical protein
MVAVGLLGWGWLTKDDAEAKDEGEATVAEEDATSAPDPKDLKGRLFSFVRGNLKKFAEVKTKGARVQNKLAELSRRVEKVTMLLDWTVPSNTIVLVYVITVL